MTLTFDPNTYNAIISGEMEDGSYSWPSTYLMLDGYTITMTFEPKEGTFTQVGTINADGTTITFSENEIFTAQ